MREMMKVAARVDQVAGLLFGYKAWIIIIKRRRDGKFLLQTTALFR
jgi:hypothetical protein